MNKIFDTENIVILDGAMGTMLQKAGLKAGALPELLGITHPDKIVEIHKQYIEAGAEIIYTNTFGANAYKMKDSGYDVSQIISQGVENARKACKGTGARVALDIGPIGKMLEPSGELSFDEAYESFKEQVIAGKNADLIVFETMTDLYEVKAAVLAARENTNLPILCTMTFEKNHRTFTGCPVSAMALTLEGMGVSAIGVNCSLGPKEILPIVKELKNWTNLPIVVKPNAGLPDPETNQYNVTPNEFALEMKELISYGVKYLGGCCGTTPEFIKELKRIFACEKFQLGKGFHETAVCSGTETVVIDSPVSVGERLNPTGRKLLKEALISKNMDYVNTLAIEQANAGAGIINNNAGVPEVNEKQVLKEMVQSVQSVVEIPIMIDSVVPEVLEHAARYCNGKPILNSVNGEEQSLSRILPIVKKYGTCIVGLTLDNQGIPSTAEGRVAIAEKILKRVLQMGIPKENLLIDCLALTVSSEQDTAMETLNAIKIVREKLGLKTVLGVSNISFGLPNRRLINSSFLTMALQNGLNLPIINVNDESMVGALHAYCVVANIDKSASHFIERYKESKDGAIPLVKKEINLAYCIENGMKKEVRELTSVLLKTMVPMEIIDSILIPVLDKSGVDFEKGDIFLPQLLLSAGAAQEAFEVLKEEMHKNRQEAINKGNVVLATVKGDVHDIGKNIVKTLLQNYGYNVIDLGKSVEYELIVEAAKVNNAKLVGLSALMTSTLVSMKETIELLKKNKIDCQVVVGGAVLTPEYAKKIGADFYAKDAKDTVEIAKKIYN